MDYIYDLGLREIRREFINKLKKYQPKDGSTEAFNEEGNFDKNRYEDVVLWDKTRVKVTINPDKGKYLWFVVQLEYSYIFVVNFFYFR